MKIKKKVLQKIISFFSTVLILLNSFTPYLLIAPTFSQVKAEEPIATSEASVEVATPTPTVEPTATPILTPTSAPSQWTFEKVELNKEYVSPQNNEVKLTFTKLPDPAGNIKIEEITLTEDQINQTGSLSNKAYDITSDMKDGDFSYNLSLPIPESSKGKSVEVKFAETVSDLSKTSDVTEETQKENDTVTVKGLDHFTVFIITGTAPPSASNVIDDGDTNFSTNGSWSNYAAGMNGDHKYTSNATAGKWARWTFTDAQLPVTGQSYAISAHWVVWSDHATNAVYKLYDNNNVLINTFTAVDQSKKADGVSASNGTLSGWKTFSGTFTLQNGYYIQLETNGSNSRNVVADAVKIETASAPAEVWVDKNWSSQPAGTDLGSDKVYGYNAFSNIQSAISAVSADGTINVAAGTYIEVGQIIIDKNISIIGADKTTTIIKSAQDTGSSGDSRGWILVNSGKNFTLKNTTLDGEGRLINIGILSHGPGTIDNNIVKNIGYNPSGPDYAGRGIAFYDVDTTIINNIVQNYGRIGIYKYGGSGTTLIEGNTIEGKGVGDHLDYAIEIEGGASAEIKGNTISNNKGVASVDGSTSAGIMATTYFAPGTNLKITNNLIHDNSYGVAIGYDSDTTSISQFDSNTLSNNDHDFDNYTVNNVDARNNIWSVTDQNNLDQIEAKINHYCSGSTYVHGVCSGTDDYGTGFGMVQYANIGTPTNSGWNLQSKSATPNETPLDLACGEYSKENSVSQNWTAVSGANIKYQREVTFPSNAVSYFEAGSNTYTPFSTFGSGTGIEGLWKTKVRAYVDANSNNKYDSGEEVSSWSNECQITFDKTNPTNPGTPVATVTSPTNQTTITWNWTAATDPISGIKNYLWNLWKGIEKKDSGTTTDIFKTLNLSSYGDGNFIFNVQSEDNAGNVSGVMTSAITTVDTVAPNIPTLNSPIDGFATKGVAFTQTWNAVSGAILYEYQSCNVDPDDTGGICSNIKYSSTHTGITKSVGAGQPDSHFWWRVKAKDAAGNWSGWSVARELIIDNTAPAKPTITSPTAEQYFKTSPILNQWGAITDASGIKQYAVEYIYDDGHTFASPPYRYTTTNSRNHSPNITEQGGVTIRVRAEDKAGNIGEWSNPIHYIYDATAPVITCPNMTVSNDIGQNGAIVNFSGSATDAISGSLPIIYSPLSGSFLPVGVTSVSCSATDSAGNGATTSFNVTVNDDEFPTTPGTPTTTTPTSNDVPTWSWTGSTDNAPGVHYVFYWGTTSGSEDNNSGDLTSLNFTHSSPLADGTWYGKVKAVDAFGNSTESGVGSVVIDTVAPTTTINNPTSSQYFNSAINISGNTEDAGGVAHVNLSYANFDGETCGEYSPMSTLTPTENTTNYSWSYSWSPTNQGNFCIKAAGTDTVGNEEHSAVVTNITYDTVNPTVEYVSPNPANNLLTNAVNQTFKISSSEKLSKADLYFDGGNSGFETGTDGWVTNGKVTRVSGTSHSGNYSLRVGDAHDSPSSTNTAYKTVTLPSSGTLSLNAWVKRIANDGYRWDQQKIYVTDNNGNMIRYLMDTLVNEGGWTNVNYDLSDLHGQTIRIYFYTHDDGAGDPSYMYVDDVNVSGSSTGSSYSMTISADMLSATYDFSSIPEGSHQYYVVGTDLSGNDTTLETRSLTIDVTVPAIVSKTTFEGWYNTEQTSTFTYSDTNGIESGNNSTCVINTEGTNQTCSVTPSVCDAAGNCNTTTVTSNGADIDFTNPESTITSPSNSGTGSTVYTSNWTGLIEGTATDNLSGVNNIKISIENGSGQYFNGEEFITSEGEILLDTEYVEGNWKYNRLTSPIEGSYTIRSHAIDNATNMESTYTLTVILDKTIPEVTISLNPAVADASNGWYKTQPEITLTATDEHKDIVEYQWGSQTGTWTTYSGPFKPGSEGEYVLYYRARDLANNYSGVGIKNIKWDQTELTDGPLNVSVSPNPTSGTTSVVKWETAKDNIGIDRYEVKWSLKNGDKSYTDSVGSDIREHTINNLIEGDWTIEVKAFDGSGKSKSASTDLTVDRTGPSAPTLSIFGTSVGSVSLSWSKVNGANNYIIWYGTNPGSYQYGAKVGDVQGYTVQGLGAGSYYFIVKAMDPAGNQSGNSNEVSTGTIVGAPGVAENTPAEGFTENVLGEATKSAELKPTGSVLGTTEKNGKKKIWWWPWILLLLLPPGFWFGYKKWKKS